MPVKVVIAAGVILVVAVGMAIYENEELREQIKVVVEHSRRKTAEFLHQLADNVSGASNRRESMSPMTSSSVELGRASGYDVNNHTVTRRRASRSDSPMVFETGSDSGASGLGEKMIGVSRRSSTSTLPALELNEKPLPLPPSQEQESGYDSQHTPVSTPPQNPFVNSQPFWSIHEWQEDAADARSSSPSLAGSDKALSDAGSDSADSAGSWTEIGSEISADEHH